MTKRAANIGLLRKLSDRALVELFFDDTTSRAVSHRVILERMKRDGYVEFFAWTWDTNEKLADKPPVEKGAPAEDTVVDDNIIPITGPNETLRRELTAIMKSSYDFSGVFQPKRCKEFCTERGNVLSLKEKQLSMPQKRMLGLIRDRADRFLRGER
jgi:hypothetical protein